MQYGLIGKTLEHSFSKKYFTKKFSEENISANYSNFEISDTHLLLPFLESTNCEGLNITIPYKQIIIPYLHSLTPIAKKINAVNCIKKINGNWVGHNTDVQAFEKSFIKKIKPVHIKALILGNGGASKAVQLVLQNLNIPYLIVGRKMDSNIIQFCDINEKILQQYPIIINTTPLGTFPDIHTLPALPYHFLTSKNYLFDLVYNPAETLFLQNGKFANATIQNGQPMLQYQAEAAWYWWNEI